TAKTQGEQHFVTVAGHETLSLQGDVAHIFPFDSAVDCITGADELVQTEGKGRKTCFRVGFTPVTGQQPVLDDNFAGRFIHALVLAERFNGGLYAARLLPDQPTILLLQTESTFDP